MSSNLLELIDDLYAEYLVDDNQLLREKFENAFSNYARIDFFLKNKSQKINEKIHNFVTLKYDNNNESNQKNEKSSESYRVAGNEFYIKKQNENAFKMYTLAFLYAPQVTEKRVNIQKKNKFQKYERNY